MKHLKLFEGYFSDKIEKLLNELRLEMRDDLQDWVNVFSDELDEVWLEEPYISDNIDKSICTHLVINFRKKSPIPEELEFIHNNYESMKNTLKSTYELYITWKDKSGDETDFMYSEEKNTYLKNLKNIKKIEISIKGL